MDKFADSTRMSNADMIQYCDEALGWEAFGPIDIYFFESVKKILLGQSSQFEEADEDNLMGIERPVQDSELQYEYHKFADIYYTEDDEEDVPDYTKVQVEENFPDREFGKGFFSDKYTENDKTVTIGSDDYTIVE